MYSIFNNADMSKDYSIIVGLNTGHGIDTVTVTNSTEQPYALVAMKDQIRIRVNMVGVKSLLEVLCSVQDLYDALIEEGLEPSKAWVKVANYIELLTNHFESTRDQTYATEILSEDVVLDALLALTDSHDKEPNIGIISAAMHNFDRFMKEPVWSELCLYRGISGTEYVKCIMKDIRMKYGCNRFGDLTVMALREIGRSRNDDKV